MKKLISLIILLFVFNALSSSEIALNTNYNQSFIDKQNFKEQFLKKDKALHFGCSFIITTAGFMYGQSNGFNRNDSKVIGVGLGALIGLGKEYYDTKKKPPTKFSIPDLIADGFGIVSAIGLIEISK